MTNKLTKLTMIAVVAASSGMAWGQENLTFEQRMEYMRYKLEEERVRQENRRIHQQSIENLRRLSEQMDPFRNESNQIAPSSNSNYWQEQNARDEFFNRR